MVPANDTPLDYPLSLPAMFVAVQRHHMIPGFLNERIGNRWVSLSLDDSLTLVRRLACGLHEQGVQPGDRVAIMGPSSPYWLLFDLAIMAAGAVTVPLFADWSPTTQTKVCQQAQPVAILTDGPEAAQAVAGISFRFRKHFTRHADQDTSTTGATCSYRHLLLDGDDLARRDPTWIDNSLRALTSDNLATIIFTSGSTGDPKGVPLTHRMLHHQVATAGRCFTLRTGTDRALSCLPLAHVFERVVSYSYLAQGIPIYFADSIMNLGTLLADVRPTVMTVVPRILEKFQQRITRAANDSGGLKRILSSWALGTPLHGLRQQLADRFIFSTIRQRLGGRLRYLIVGGAALAPATERFFTSIGIPLYQGYGMTEAGPVLAVNHPGHARPGTVGPAFPGVRLKIAEDGEILAKSPSIMQGYYRASPSSQVVIDADGWLHTGDLGSIDADGFLSIAGRKKDLLKTAGGKMVTPVPIEHALCRSPYVDQAMVVAEGRPYVSALLFADHQAILAAVDQAHETTDLNAHPAIRSSIEAMLHTVNSELDHAMQVRNWVLVDETLLPDSGLITPTLKLRRKALREHYQQKINDLYEESAAS
jgi:long-chain acyl-CoA synthetase